MSHTAGATGTAPDRTRWSRFLKHHRDSIVVRPLRRHVAAARCCPLLPAAARCSKHTLQTLSKRHQHILRHVQHFTQIYSTHTPASQFPGMKAQPYASPMPPGLDKREKTQTDVEMCCCCVVVPLHPLPIPRRQPSECVCLILYSATSMKRPAVRQSQSDLSHRTTDVFL